MSDFYRFVYGLGVAWVVMGHIQVFDDKLLAGLVVQAIGLVMLYFGAKFGWKE